MKKIIIIRSKVSLATLHNRRDFGKRLDKINKLTKDVKGKSYAK